jgi:hypothetical protein
MMGSHDTDRVYPPFGAHNSSFRVTVGSTGVIARFLHHLWPASLAAWTLQGNWTKAKDDGPGPDTADPCHADPMPIPL